MYNACTFFIGKHILFDHVGPGPLDNRTRPRLVLPAPRFEAADEFDGDDTEPCKVEKPRDGKP